MNRAATVHPCPIGARGPPRPSALVSKCGFRLYITRLCSPPTNSIFPPCLTITIVPPPPKAAQTTTATSLRRERRRMPTLRLLSVPDAPTTLPPLKPQVTSLVSPVFRLLALNFAFMRSHQPRERCRDPPSIMSRVQERSLCTTSGKHSSPK